MLRLLRPHHSTRSCIRWWTLPFSDGAWRTWATWQRRQARCSDPSAPNVSILERVQKESWFLLGYISETFADIAQKTLKQADLWLRSWLGLSCRGRGRRRQARRQDLAAPNVSILERVQNKGWFLMGCISERLADIAQETLKQADS